MSAFLCVAQCRPTTGPTAYQHDQVGMLLRGARAAPLRTALNEGRIFREVEPDWDGDLPIRREAIPVRVDGEVIAVLGRDANLASIRTPSQLELVYLQSAADLAAMVADGTFPGAGRRASRRAPGRGSATVWCASSRDGTIIYASPNALSAFSRLGINGNVLGEPVDALTSTVADDPFDASDLATAVGGRDRRRAARAASRSTAAARPCCSGPCRCARAGETLGALLLMQDVTELRRRDRQILSKDATIREIHHRVKNNLQTVAALLRLQARRVQAPEARLALEESMRRVSSIALVHETLSVSIDEAVDFDEIVDRLLVMLSDVMGSADADPGPRAPALRGCARRGGHRAGAGADRTRAERDRARVSGRRPAGWWRSSPSGPGAADGDDPRRRHRPACGLRVGTSDRLGLQIVRTLVSAELAGSVEFTGATDGGGADAVVSMALGRRPRIGG